MTTSQAYIDATAREQRDAVRANRTYQALAQLASTDDAQTSECPRTAPATRPGSGGDAGHKETPSVTTPPQPPRPGPQ